MKFARNVSNVPPRSFGQRPLDNVLRMQEHHLSPLLWKMHIGRWGGAVTKPAGGAEGSAELGGYRQEVTRTPGPLRRGCSSWPACVQPRGDRAQALRRKRRHALTSGSRLTAMTG